MERLALPPFENLTADPSLDWISAAAPAILAVEITGALKTVPVRVTAARDAFAARATEICYGRFSRFGTELRVDVVVQDLARTKTVATLAAEGPLADGILPLASAIARRLDRRAHALGTSSQDAVEQWGRALQATNPAERIAAFQKSVADDPNFGAAYVGWTQALLTAGDRAAAEAALTKAHARGTLLDDISRAQLELIAANLHGDMNGRREALVELSRLTQHDADAVRALAQEELQARHFAVAADLLRKAVTLDPGDAVLLNSFGYAQAYARDLPGAMKTFSEYGREAGQQANAFDSLGEANFYAGHFGDAERYFLKAHTANAALLGGGDLLKAAGARLMTGDIAAADGLFHQYEDFRRRFHDPNLGIESARWEYLTGRRDQAIKDLALLSGSGPGVQRQLCVWYLQSGDVSRAAACHDPAAPATKLQAAAALLLNKRFADAVPLFQQLYQQTNPAVDGQIRTLYAWALIETGRVKDAQEQDLVELYPIPGFSGDPMFASLMFPRFLHLRSVVRDYQGHREEAAQCQKLYTQLGGR
ncbi:MAG: tetratricopeptide repeat protein [Bryobacteraceae bacterium]